jgi:hypothetical protein
MSKKPLVAVLGCGPAGLMAAHACRMYGVPYVIFSRKQKSPLGGAQFSHIPILGLCDSDLPEAMLKYQVDGDAEVYQQKVYGSRVVPFVSIDNVKDGQTVPAWNLRDMYDQLWNSHEGQIIDLAITPDFMDKFDHSIFDLVLNSIHANSICRGTVDPLTGHWFRHQPVSIHNAALIENIEDNTIIYDGTPDHSWYRMSKIFGVGSTEWGGDAPLPPVNGVKTVRKPIATNCDCYPDVVRIGRFGTWTKGVLTFHAYGKTLECLGEMGVDVTK